MARTTPSFIGLTAASDASARATRGNRNRDTSHELVLRRELWAMGLRYRKNVFDLPGKPDVAFPGAKVAVFCGGDFWHGRNWDTLHAKLAAGHNPGYWPAKIARNIERDRRNTEMLERDGWLVVRLWESDIKRDSKAAAVRVRDVVMSRKNGGRLR